ncbi:hypothetical protein GH714_030194 [Hevea brasiliensis]|uniref:Methylenetetrahydrofolate reductase n=1 Tax=Hevea brasiliensis TaxID=3981 RepID=A0A6A6NK55_HEVBR|nr:hypothetical protein GH714_030194 [Hevea brasiliensis]
MATTLALLSLVIQVLKAILGFLLCPILLHYPQKIISLCSSVIFLSEAHPDMIGSDGVATPENYQKDLEYLKRKVDAGADLIITQLFYGIDIFLEFVNDCRQIGINCPIVPRIMAINNYKGFLQMTSFCKTKIPAEVTAALEPIKDNEEAVRAYGIHLGTEVCKKILAHGIKTLHLYTLNMEKSALAILMNLGLIDESKITRSLPWRRPTNVFVQRKMFVQYFGLIVPRATYQEP